jgi:C4-type Zn-finger protein|tara:strand:+ start:358 stop:597 length:240 start_codon:yes stop_codon:yes gene_type:complete
MANKKCEAHHYLLEAPNGKKALGVCKHCGHKKTHSNINERVVTKRVVAKGRKAQNVVGIRLKGHKGHFANGFKSDSKVN